LNFPADVYEEVALYDWLTEGFNIKPKKALKGKTDYLLVYENEKQILDLTPDFGLVGKIDARGVIVTAKGNEVDFVSRFFAPQCGIDEDPVTGSAHTTLAPYWGKQLGKTEMNARQLSPRVGVLHCKLNGDRVIISGKGKLFLEGSITF
jgi:predicted PhzF superfamily epimerase YddE/YHI9